MQVHGKMRKIRQKIKPPRSSSPGDLTDTLARGREGLAPIPGITVIGSPGAAAATVMAGSSALRGPATWHAALFWAWTDLSRGDRHARPMHSRLLFIFLWTPLCAALRSTVLSLVDQKTRARVTLVGTVHFNPASIALAAETVKEVAADGSLYAVALETCPSRWNTTMQQQPAGSPLRSLLDNEMQAAAEAGIALGAETILADQPIEETSSRLIRLFGVTLLDLATPWNGGWSRITRDIRDGYTQVIASGSAGPIDGARRVFERATEPSLVAGTPIAFGRYLLAFAVTSPALFGLLIATTVYYAYYFGLIGADAGAITAVTLTADASNPIATIGDGKILVDARPVIVFQLLQWVIYARVFLIGLLDERNRVLARNIRRAAAEGGSDRSVVAVLGVAHLDGVRELLSRESDEL